MIETDDKYMNTDQIMATRKIVESLEYIYIYRARARRGRAAELGMGEKELLCVFALFALVALSALFAHFCAVCDGRFKHHR